MFICNLKINKNIIWKILITILIISITILIGFASFKIFFSYKDSNSTKQNILEINSDEYTNFLKASHENIDDYIGMDVNITGYIYRLPDFSSTQFVLARTMILEDPSQSVIVGMLCECSSATKYDTGTWINISGTIERGNYNSELPIIKVNDIKAVSSPKDEFVYLQD